jgi:hypothetical protein
MVILGMQLLGGRQKVYKNQMGETLCTDNLEDDGQH